LAKNVKVQNNVSIYTGVTCEDDVFLGPSMVFTNVTNPRSNVNRRGQYTRTLVKKEQALVPMQLLFVAMILENMLLSVLVQLLLKKFFHTPW